MKRGEIFTAAARGPYTGTPRPVVVIQDDRFDATASVTVCPLTTNPVEAPLTRLVLHPTELNGLDHLSTVMIDKVVTMPRTGLRDRVGRLADDEIVRLNRAVVVFLGLAG